MQYPKKSEQVYVEAIDQELCVYDWQRQKMHTLNPTAALVWQQCDGQTSPVAMAARLEQELNVPDAEKLVWLSLDRLEKAHLLEEKVTRPTPGQRRFTRREVLKVAGISLALLPVVKSIMLPTPAQAQCSPNCIVTGLVPPTVSCAVACSNPPPGVTLCSVGETPTADGNLCECRVYISPSSDYVCRDGGDNIGSVGLY